MLKIRLLKSSNSRSFFGDVVFIVLTKENGSRGIILALRRNQKWGLILTIKIVLGWLIIVPCWLNYLYVLKRVMFNGCLFMDLIFANGFKYKSLISDKNLRYKGQNTGNKSMMFVLFYLERMKNI